MAVSVAKQSDAQFKTYQSLQQSGAASSAELDGVNSLLHNFGLGVANANKLVEILAANGPALATFAGTVADGARRMGAVTKLMGDSGLRKTFNQLGISTDEQRESIASYISLQSQLGFTQVKNTKELTQSTAKYLMEQDALTRATGATRKQQEDSQKKALAIEQFRARQNRLQLEGKGEQAQRELAAFKMLEAEAGEDIAAQFGASLDGFITDFNKGLVIATGGMSTEIARRFAEGQMSPEQMVDALRVPLKEYTVGVGAVQAGVGKSKELTGIDFGKLSEFTIARTELEKRLIAAAKEQEKTAKEPGAGVAGQAELIEANIKVQTSLENLRQYGIAPVTGAMGKLAGIVNWLSEKLNVGARGETGSTDTSSGDLSKELDSIFKKLPKYADGGIATGNESGHLAILHGTEAVIPLKGGAIPLQIKSGMPPAGPVFGPENETNFLLEKSNEELVKSNVTLDKILTAITGGAGLMGGGGMEQALSAHDASHKHEPPTITPDAAKELSKGLGSPLENLKVTSGFGMRIDPFTGKQAGHGGVDLAGRIGDIIKAPEGGTARVRSEAESGGYGNVVEILDANGKMIHRMAHMSEMLVKTGDKIEAGAQIGKVGSTGRSTGAHLHWEQFDPRTGQQIDPIAALAARQGKTPGFVTGPGGAAFGNPMATRRGQRMGATQYPNVPMMGTGLGAMSEKYETGGRGSETIGWDQVGGTSYGKYQIASKVGAMTDFLKFAEQSGRGDIAAKLRAAGAETDTGTAGGKAADVWKQLAASGELGDLEHQFIKKRSFDPAMAGLQDPKLRKMIEGNKGLQEMMWSTSVQHGGAGASSIMNKVFKQGMSQEDLVKAVYAERGTRFGGSTEEVQKSVQNRFMREQGDVMAMLGMPAAKGSTMLAGVTPAAAPPAQSPTASLAQSVMGMLGFGTGTQPTAGVQPALAGITAGGAPGAIGGDITAITQAMQAQTEATQTAITSGMENLTNQLVSKIGGGGTAADPAVPTLLSEILSAQREQTGAINRLIQVNTS